MPSRPTLRQLEYFLAAVEHGSFAAAAAAEHVTQPSLSEQIQRLERMIGAALFVRTNRTLRLTDVGRQLIPHAQNALRSAETFAERARDVRSLTGGTVTLGTFSSAYLYLLVPVTTAFRLRHPDVRVRVLGLNSSEVAAMVRAGDLEAGLVQLPIDERGLDVSAPVLVDTVVYVSSDRRRTREPVTVEALAQADLILSEARWGEADPLRRRLAERARAAGVEITPVVEVEFLTAAIELAGNGVGDTLASYLVARLPQFANLVSFAPLEPVLEERFAIVTRQGGALSPATRVYLELAVEHLRALQASTDTFRS